MCKYGSMLVALLVLSLGATSTPAKTFRGDEKTKVEVYLATEHVPEGLKAGDMVTLFRVNAKNVTPGGKVSYVTVPMAANLEVVSVKKMEKPKRPEQAVKVELRVSKEQAEKIEQVKAVLITSREMKPDGSVETTQKPVTFRLEPTPVEKK
jgi:uncharacterized lipoprotein